LDAKLDVSGKRVLVTGASSGLGESFAQTLALAGAKVAVAARRIERLDALRERLADAEHELVVTRLDVTDGESVSSAIGQVEDTMGGIDVLVNNSGVASTVRAEQMTEEDFDWVIDTNLKGAWRVAQRVGRGMIESKLSGSIINIESILSYRVSSGLLAYAASKAGLQQVTRTLALEWARYNVRVNGIAPGYIETAINREFFQSEAGQRVIKKIPQRRIGKPADLDGVLLLLASDASTFMTGSTLVVDGGHMVNSL